MKRKLTSHRQATGGELKAYREAYKRANGEDAGKTLKLIKRPTNYIEIKSILTKGYGEPLLVPGYYLPVMTDCLIMRANNPNKSLLEVSLENL